MTEVGKDSLTMFSHPSETFCRAGQVPADAPEAPLLHLAKQRGWRVVSYADDGTGEVELAPGVFLEFANAKDDEEDEDDYTVAVRFHAKNLPITSADLATFLPVALERAATCIETGDAEFGEKPTRTTV